MFLTGSAGTGKSHVIKELLRVLPPSSTFGTACTGVASSAVGGTTIYSFAGIGKGEESKEILLKKVKGKRDVCARIKACSILIIDEISMLSSAIFDKLGSN